MARNKLRNHSYLSIIMKTYNSKYLKMIIILKTKYQQSKKKQKSTINSGPISIRQLRFL
jgi:hypothetical protein